SILLMIFNKNKPVNKLKYFDEGYIDYRYEEKKERKSIIKSLSKLVPNFKFDTKIREYVELEIIRADLPLTYNELIVIEFLISFTVGILIFLLTKNIIVALSLSLSTFSFPSIFMLKRKIDRIKKFDSQLSEAIVVISNSLKAGYSFLQAISVVG
ncbi:MAG: secretion system protein, partial [Caloramator sp.]|nr:secretion system protein [Caloramator sp.]